MIDILLATYNGEKYLREWLQSLSKQTYSDWRLLVHDDGSTDHSMHILREETAGWPQEVKILPPEPKPLGAIRSFEKLLKASDSDYCAFADQDDVWLPEKLALCIEAMQKEEAIHERKTPIVVHTDMRVVDSELNKIDGSFWQYSNLRPALLESDVHYLAVANCLTGCTMLLNNAAREVALPIGENAYMHDAWTGLQVMLHGGEIVAIDTPTLLYRQHEGNTLGAVRYRFSLLNWKEKWRLARQSYRGGHPQVFKNRLHFAWWKMRYFIALHI